MTEMSDMTDDKLLEMRADIDDELRSREPDKTAEAIDQLLRNKAEREGWGQGAEWKAPTHAGDSYPLGWQVTYDGKMWESTIAGNPHEPGVAGWDVVSEDGSPNEWRRPSHAGEVYSRGDLVIYRGKTYKAVMDNLSHSPSEFPAGWSLQEDTE